ncbi:hypothetical protein BHAP_0821 [Bifidobacterium hapali]|uniref:Uncharacterized protein n=1 Tax=Bifidobacterium hapali TaxID=1630172 RepID=A0A261G133_9BIFI|nr:hypothetical protein [Bifidobacterium hapali]OZG64883.1 hypothetical protein BHAP_0821 [Bifidobacterium hapali]
MSMYTTPKMYVVRLMSDDIVRTSDGTVRPPEPDWCTSQGLTPDQCAPGNMG